MRIVISGASGLIGSALRRALEARGDHVVRLVRRAPRDAGEVQWAPDRGELDPEALRGADAVVNLSGASLSRLPWTRRYRREILESRTGATDTIVAALAALDDGASRLPALINGSATGIYGDRPGERLDETAVRGTGFLADVVDAWEASALRAPDRSRVVLARTGLVIADGGALAPLRLMARLGVAGPISGGRQHWAWVALDDEVGALVHLIDHEITGAVNLVGPTPATAGEVVRALAARLRRPYWLPLPLAELRGEAGRELLGADQAVRPAVLTASGYVFAHADIDSALAAVLGPGSSPRE